jgi:hypothetical protein
MLSLKILYLGSHPPPVLPTVIACVEVCVVSWMRQLRISLRREGVARWSLS